MKVIWTSESLTFYDLILVQLNEKWNKKIAENFELEVFHLINLIENYNHICPKSKVYGFHKCVLNKHNSLIYKFENNDIFLISFLFNKSQHFY